MGGSSAASSIRDASVSAKGAIDASHTSGSEQVPDAVEKPEANTSEASSLGLPLHYYRDLKSILYAKGVELEERLNVLVAQLTMQHVNLPVFLVSNVLLFTVGVFIGRRSSPEIL